MTSPRLPSNSVTLPATPRCDAASTASPASSNSVASRACRVSSSPTPRSLSSALWRPRASFSMSLWASSATNEPSASLPSGLISASVMSFSTNSLASRVTIGTRRLRSEPVTPVEATTSLASKSPKGRMLEKCRRPTLSGCSSATCSMSIPPTGEKMMTGRLAVPSDHAGVELLRDVGLGVDEHAAGLMAVDLEREDVAGVPRGLARRVGELHPAPLHAPAGQDLGLDDDGAADALGDRPRLGRVRREAVVGDRDPGPFDD